MKEIVQNIAIGSGNNLLALKSPLSVSCNLRLETSGPPVSVLFITCADALNAPHHCLGSYFCYGCAYTHVLTFVLSVSL